MPKLKPNDTELANRRTRAIISYGMDKEDISEKELAKRMCRDVRTVQNKRNKPETINLGELRIFCKLFKLTKEQIIEMLGVEVNDG